MTGEESHSVNQLLHSLSRGHSNGNYTRLITHQGVLMVHFFLWIIAFFIDLLTLVLTINKSLRARVELEFNRSAKEQL